MKTDDLLVELENRYSLPAAYRTCMRFMLACLAAIESSFSPTARGAFEVATRYWAGHATDAELEAARIDCWNILDESNAETSLVEKEHCATRAVLCVTYAAPASDDIVEVLTWFVKVVRLAGCPESHIEASLVEAFGS